MSERTCHVEGCVKPTKARGLCDRHYSRLLRHGHTNPTRATGILEECYSEGPRDQCWVWRGSFNAYGYGRFGNPVHMAHRIVFEKHRGAIPDGLHLDHLCRNKACVNPWHLDPVTNAVNVARGLNGYAMRDLCRNGLHDVSSPEAWYVGTYGTRTCLECKRANDRRAEAKRGPRKRRQASGRR